MNYGGWLHSFKVEASLHEDSIVYHIESVIFPRKIPAAMTRMAVCKRFDDIKRLYRTLQRLHHNLELPGKLPAPPKAGKGAEACTDSELEQLRVDFTKKLLEFAAIYPELYRSYSFSQFLVEEMKEPKVKRQPKRIAKLPTTEADEGPNVDNCLYIYEAALDFSSGLQADVEENYDLARSLYLRGVNLLLEGVQDDNNLENRRIAEQKISKYRARLSELRHQVDFGDNGTSVIITIDREGLERPCVELAWYLLEKVLYENVLKVRGERSQAHCVAKFIPKSLAGSAFQSIFLPTNVSFMTELLVCYNSDDYVIVLLECAAGGMLYDYVLDANVDLLEHQDDLLSLTHTNFVKNKFAFRQQAVVGAAERTIAQLQRWAAQLALAIQGLHENGVILGDLNSSNLLKTADDQLQLSYFYQYEQPVSGYELARKPFSAVAVQGHFVAPDSTLAFKSDWWSYGVVLYELLSGKSFKEMHPNFPVAYDGVELTSTLELVDGAAELLNELLVLEAERRPNFEQIRAHNFFKNVEWQKLQ